MNFGDRKLTHSRLTKGGLAEDIERLEGEIAALKEEVLHLANLCESLETREAEREVSYEERPKEIVELELEQQQLNDLLVALRPSKPEKGK